jgi:hypothetical protein
MNVTHVIFRWISRDFFFKRPSDSNTLRLSDEKELETFLPQLSFPGFSEFAQFWNQFSLFLNCNLPLREGPVPLTEWNVVVVVVVIDWLIDGGDDFDDDDDDDRMRLETRPNTGPSAGVHTQCLLYY